MNERIRELRKALQMTMEQFGKILGLSKSGISEIESGRRNVTEQHIKLIISNAINGHYVNEHWLRTGEGDVFKQLDVEEEIAVLIAQIPNEPKGSFKKRLLSVLARLDEDDWQTLAKIAEELAKEMADE